METILKAQNGFVLDPVAALAVPVVIGLVEVAKSAGLPPRLAPLASIALGIGLSALAGLMWQQALIQGTLVGLASCGLWSGARATMGIRSSAP